MAATFFYFKKTTFYTLLCCSVFFFRISFGQITVASVMTPAQYVQNVLLGPGITATNITYNGSAAAANTPQTNVSSFDATTTSLQIQQGLLLSTGAGSAAVGPNNQAAASTPGTPSVAADPDLNVLAAGTVTNGVFLEFDFVSNTNLISFDYIFGSEEYPEFAPPNSSSFNDVFGFLLSGPGIAGGQGFLNNAVNIAVLPNNSFVSINNVNPVTNNTFYADNTGGAAHGTAVQYDGTTIKLTATRTIDCGVTYHIKMCICNVGDTGFDSGVFLESNSFASTAVISAGAPQSVCATTGTIVSLNGSSGSTTGNTWTTSGTGTFSNPASPTSNYTVSAADITAGNVTLTYAGFNFCSGAPVSSTTTLNFISPTATVSPTNALICLPSSPTVNFTGTATANPSIRVFRTFSNTTAGNIPNNNGAGVSRTIAVSGIAPNNLATNPIVNVTVNITHAKSRELELRLIAPSGQNFQLVPSSTGLFGAGANFTATVFTANLADPTIGGANPPFNGGFRPITPLTNFTGAINGNWTLVAIDAFGSLINNLPNNNNVGQLVNWSITFQTDNFITSTVWSPPLNLSSTSTINTTANPPTSTNYNLTVTDAAGCSTVIPVSITVANCALPVELISFEGNCSEQEIGLNWWVASEVNNHYFQIERSIDGEHFEPIGTVISKGDHSSNMNYRFQDSQNNIPPFQTIYYRLSQVDNDGKSEILETLVIQNDCKQAANDCFTVAPTIVTATDFGVQVDAVQNNEEALTIMDMNGRICLEKQFETKGDSHIEKVYLPENMAAGTYFVVLTNRFRTCKERMIVQRN